MSSNNKTMSPSLKQLNLLKCYSTSRNSLADEFYTPCLENSVKYDRASGYFRSSVFHLCSQAITDFAIRGGKIRLICSPEMSLEDIEAIKAGYALRDRVGEVLSHDIEKAFEQIVNRPVVEFLVILIAIQCIDIRIAL